MSDEIRATTKEELSTLLYLETRAVDYGGRVSGDHLNAGDLALMKTWNDANYVRSGRIVHKDCNGYGSTWCELSDAAWEDAARERKARAERAWKARNFARTCDRHAEAAR